MFALPLNSQLVWALIVTFVTISCAALKSTIEVGPSLEALDGSHLTRNLLAALETTSKPPADEGNGTLVKWLECIYMYSAGGSGKVTIYTIIDADKDEKKIAKEVTFTLDKEPTVVSGQCPNSSTSGTGILEVVWDNVGENITKVTLNMVIELIQHKGHWLLSEGTLKTEGKGSDYTIDISTKRYPITASNGFSFSCLDLELYSETRNRTDTFRLNLKRFQIQPFNSTAHGVIFMESFDCSTWFTIPLWMGLFTLLLFSVIVAFGVYLLFEIKTMDRFENPKGKTITVPLGD